MCWALVSRLWNDSFKTEEGVRIFSDTLKAYSSDDIDLVNENGNLISTFVLFIKSLLCIIVCKTNTAQGRKMKGMWGIFNTFFKHFQQKQIMKI